MFKYRLEPLSRQRPASSSRYMSIWGCSAATSEMRGRLSDRFSMMTKGSLSPRVRRARSISATWRSKAVRSIGLWVGTMNTLSECVTLSSVLDLDAGVSSKVATKRASCGCCGWGLDPMCSNGAERDDVYDSRCYEFRRF